MAKDIVVPLTAASLPIADHVLVEQARSGDMGAFSRLVVKYQDRVLNTCWRICGNVDDAQDLAQDAFLRALESIGSFQGQSGFFTWLFRIAVNLSISHRRKSARAVKLSLHSGDDGQVIDHQEGRLVGRVSDDPEDPPARLTAREMERLVLEGLERLDDAHRAVIVLKDVESLDYQQIAEILEVPVGTVKSRLHRGRMMLRDRLKAMGS